MSAASLYNRACGIWVPGGLLFLSSFATFQLAHDGDLPADFKILPVATAVLGMMLLVATRAIFMCPTCGKPLTATGFGLGTKAMPDRIGSKCGTLRDSQE